MITAQAGAPVLTVQTGTSHRLRVHVSAPDVAMRKAVLSKLRHTGIALAAEPDRGPDTVLLAAAGTVEQALAACPLLCRAGGYRLLVVAETFSSAGVRCAVRAGARAMLRAAEATPRRLAAAVHGARHGDGRMPYAVLVRLLGGTAEPPVPPPAPTAAVASLTTRQTSVLALMAEGHSNAAIARSLSCSQHTVKNVIYELMARLQARNRAHAVARAVVAGLI